MEKFLRKHNFNNQLKKLKTKLKGKKVIVYGAGKLFQTIYKKYDLSGIDIIGICDKNFSALESNKLFDNINKIIFKEIDLYEYDYILVAIKDYIGIINDFPDEIPRNKIIPLVNQFVLFKLIKSSVNMRRYLTLFGKTFVIPFSASEQVLRYLKAENPRMSQRIYSPRNLFTYMADIAAKSSAQYIIDNMYTVPTFNNRTELLKQALEIASEDGEYLEFGVYKGASINYIAQQKKEKTIYGFDSFEGLPEDWDSTHPAGHFKITKLPKVRDNVRLIEGWYDETVPEFIKEKGDFKISFLHSDSDLYSSTKTMFDLISNNIESGTIIVFDEYFNYPNWENGEFKAFQEFIHNKNFEYKYLGYVYNSTQVAVQIL